MQLIILAAGRGYRLPEKFRNKPKCLALINGKTILEHNLNFFKKFKKRYIITGYKNNKISKFAKTNNFKAIKNKKYISTNMVYSLFLTKNFINDDVLICYGDIIFNENINKKLKKNFNQIPLNLNWLSLWKKRMSLKKIKKDAEDVVVKNKKIIRIGTKIKKYPLGQFMGIIKIKKKSFFKLSKYFNENCDPKMDMTTFINETIKNKITNFYSENYRSFWFEIDTKKDIEETSKLLKNLKISN